MELELKKTSLDAYETGGELTLTQEETAETIVPDYLPDIARIIETEGRVFLHSRELRDGKAEVSGTVRVTVLYTPEGEGGIRTLDFSIPFTVESDSRALPGCQYLGAQTQTEFLETRTLNPRKIFTHCKLVTVLTGYQKSTLCVCTDADVERYTQSVEYDKALYEHDIAGSRAHARMLAKQGVLSREDAARIDEGLAQITDRRWQL